MTAVLDILIPFFAGASLLAALVYFGRAFLLRSRSRRATYGVAQQEARQAMQIDLLRGIVAAMVGLILLGVLGLSLQPEAVTPTATSPPTSISATTTATSLPPPADTVPSTTDAATPTTQAATAVPTATSPIPTITPTPTPADTPIPEPATATVNSEVGVWLRSGPSTTGQQLEWVLNGTVLTLLPGQETADELEWQQVRTPAGNEGWVAVLFIVYNE